MKLYDYVRSTACYRVRIALHHKQLPFHVIPVHLINQGGEQHLPDYLTLNPQGLVPTLVVDETPLTQSLAIIEYLEEQYPTPPLLPNNTLARAQVRSLALTIACDMHPLNNLRVLQRLKADFNATEAAVQDWYHHWLKQGFNAIETRLQSLPRSKGVCYGNHITIADLCLIPQVYNAHRFDFPLDAYPLIQEIEDYCLTLPSFVRARPLEPSL